MEKLQDRLKDISEIRDLMERNTKFLSLSGLSGISAGICALAGAAAAYVYIGNSWDYLETLRPILRRAPADVLTFFILDTLLVLVSAVGLAAFFSIRMARKRGFPVWNRTARHMLVNLFIPLAAGGAFCLIQLWHGQVVWIPATMLLFYGMALLNASKFTLPEIRYLAVTEIVLGLACALWTGKGLIFWALGFGVLHILYGAVMYYRYER